MHMPINKIDITPLIGVTLILVIVFMVTSPLMMATADFGVELPKAKTVEVKSEVNITISLSTDGRLALNEFELTPSQLRTELEHMISNNPDRLIIIRADKNIAHKEILETLSMAKKAGARNLALATLQRNRDKV